ncbi:hypothetical protein [Actinomadura harenae]|uniref:Secreted protein n=1 Tax=Actinomadura harenae TaxID=2483351 RepID=A0A3M2LQ31_9ACTN|nr:hypothetical protein [Actinomadura harenae]RMI39549.1 hypothetical protein EBO15_29255 [Actinomadura harenae]
MAPIPAELLPADEDGIRLPVRTAPSGHLRIDPRGWFTHDRFRFLAVLVVLLTVLVAALAATRASGGKAGFKEIGHQAGPQVLASSDLYLALNDMDAQLANVLLVGSAQNLGIGRQQALGTFEQRRRQADQDLQQAAALAGGDQSAARAVRRALDGFGRYQALAGQALLLDGQRPHPAAAPPAAAITLYRQATDEMKQVLLPAAEELRAANADRVGGTYQSRYRALRTGSDAVLVLGLVTLAALLLLQVTLARRTHRILNPALLLATACVLGGTITASTVLGSSADHLRVAKRDAFDSVIALTRARAIGWDANADESRYIVDRERWSDYQNAFYDKAGQLVGLPTAASLPDTYQAVLQQVVIKYRQNEKDVPFTGLLGDEFRNITFPGERTAAEEALLAWQAYQANDVRLRGLMDKRQVQAAVTFDTSPSADDSNGSFTRFDQAMARVIAVNQDQFTANIRSGADVLSGWTVVPPAAALVIIGLVLAGLRPRLAEYR